MSLQPAVATDEWAAIPRQAGPSRRSDFPVPLPGPGATMRLEVLSSFALRRGKTSCTLPPAGQRLVAYVALHDRPVRRSHVACVLWDEAAPAQCAANLRSTLWRINRACGGLLEASTTLVSLAETVTVDVLDGFRLTQAITSGSGRLSYDPDSAVPLLAADLLPDWYDEWLVPARECWRQRRLHALEILAVHLAGAGRYALAVEAALAAIAGDPLRESAHRCLIRVHLVEGNRVEAMRAYLRLDRLLERELGVMPGADVRALVAGLPIHRLPV